MSAKRKLVRRKFGVKCPHCGDRIFSWYRHNFNECKCKLTFVDGGYDYLRFGYTRIQPKIIYYTVKLDGDCYYWKRHLAVVKLIEQKKREHEQKTRESSDGENHRSHA